MARQLLQTLFVTEADILPDKEKKQLWVRFHSTSRLASNRVMEMLFEQLNRTELNYPGTAKDQTFCKFFRFLKSFSSKKLKNDMFHPQSYLPVLRLAMFF